MSKKKIRPSESLAIHIVEVKQILKKYESFGIYNVKVFGSENL